MISGHTWLESLLNGDINTGIDFEHGCTVKDHKVIFVDGVLQGSAISQFVVWGIIWLFTLGCINSVRHSVNGN